MFATDDPRPVMPNTLITLDRHTTDPLELVVLGLFDQLRQAADHLLDVLRHTRDSTDLAAADVRVGLEKLVRPDIMLAGLGRADGTLLGASAASVEAAFARARQADHALRLAEGALYRAREGAL